MPIDAREIFIRNLALLMERRGISQADITRELGVSSSTTHGWCTGRLYPRANKMQQLAELFHVTMSGLTDENGLDNLDDYDRLEALHQNPKLGMLFDHTRKMSDKDIDFMIEFAKRMESDANND